MVKHVLIIFCLASGFISGCQDNTSSVPDGQMENRPAETNQSSEESKTANTATSDENHSIVIAYYFHRTIRCPSCMKIEATAERVIESNFAKQITNEKLIWIPYNLDDSGGEEFEKEFNVSGSTLVLAKMQDGNYTKYKKLEKVWDYINAPAKFDEYVRSELEKFLNE